MRHRIVTHTGLGNPEPELLTNDGNLNEAFGVDALDTYFQDFGGFDYTIEDDSILIGIEPAYQYERLKLISIQKDKSKSYIKTGKAWGGYGSQIAANTKYYADYKYKSKFVRFVDKWHKELFE